jgi:cytochrome c-type biogenesis protein CcmH/NrfF
MGKKSSREKNKSTPAPVYVRREPSYWKVIAVVAVLVSAGLVAKIVFFPGQGPAAPTVVEYRPAAAPVDAAIESRVMQVAANFRCACGGCGELPLDECTCTMPRGAKEEKDFIREQLQKGLSVEQVIVLVEAEYGLRNL